MRIFIFRRSAIRLRRPSGPQTLTQTWSSAARTLWSSTKSGCQPQAHCLLRKISLSAARFFETFDALFKKGPAEESCRLFHVARPPKPPAALTKLVRASPPKVEGHQHEISRW